MEEWNLCPKMFIRIFLEVAWNHLGRVKHWILHFHCFCTLGTGTYGPRCREPAPNVPLTFSFVLHANQEINNSWGRPFWVTRYDAICRQTPPPKHNFSHYLSPNQRPPPPKPMTSFLNSPQLLRQRQLWNLSQGAAIINTNSEWAPTVNPTQGDPNWKPQLSVTSTENPNSGWPELEAPNSLSRVLSS